MSRLIIIAGLILLLVANPAISKVLNVPAIPADRAIAIAQEYVRKNKIDVSRHFLAQVEYFGLYDEYQKPFWRIEWRLIGQAVKGGQILVLVYPDGTASRGVGE